VRPRSTVIPFLVLVLASQVSSTHLKGAAGAAIPAFCSTNPTNPDTSAADLGGIWTADDGGTYWITTIGTCLWWVGLSGSSDPATIGTDFANVYFANASRVTVEGVWADIPRGRTSSDGTLKLVIGADGELRQSDSTGGFGGQTWKRQSPSSAAAVTNPLEPSRSCSLTSPSTVDLTGTWQASDGATYWLRQVGTCLWWAGFSTGSTPAELGRRFSNAFFGTVSTSSVAGWWADVPRGATNGWGALNLSVSPSGEVLTRSGGNGAAFAAERWTRIVTVLPSLSIEDTKAEEGADAVFGVDLSSATKAEVSMHYRTVDESATGGADYAATSGTLEFKPGETHKTISVSVLRDNVRDPDESFGMELFSPYGSTLARARGEAHIVDATIPIPLPDTVILGGPTGTVAARFARFTFRSDQGTATFECRLDSAAFASCRSGTATQELQPGLHIFAVRAQTAVGVDKTPATRSWTVAPPPVALDTILISHPKNSTASRRARLTFRSEPAGDRLQCSLDSRPFAPCTSPYITSRLPFGAHRFRVRAAAESRIDATPAEAHWRVTRPPALNTAITSGPEGSTSARTAEFTFESRPRGAAFECSLDERRFMLCRSGVTYSALTVASHSFRVRAVRGPLRDSTPALASWRVVVAAGPGAWPFIVGGAGGASFLAAAAGFFRRRRHIVRIKLRPLTLEAADAEPPKTCSVPEAYTWRHHCELKPAFRRIEHLRLSAVTSTGSTDARTIEGDVVDGLNRAVRARRFRRGPNRVRTLVEPIAEDLLGEIERWLNDQSDVHGVAVEAELTGGKLECEFRRYECVTRQDECGWKELARWKDEVEPSRTDPVTQLPLPARHDASLSLLSVALLELVERVDVRQRRTAPAAQPLYHP